MGCALIVQPPICCATSPTVQASPSAHCTACTQTHVSLQMVCSVPRDHPQFPCLLLLQVNPNIRRDKWTAEEDAKLIELVKTFGVGRWAEIARNCDGRTDQQCMGRWRRHLDPNIRRVGGCACLRVTLALAAAACMHVLFTLLRCSCCDTSAKQHLQSRPARPKKEDVDTVKCHVFVLQDSWTAEEDAKLRQLHAQYGTSWSRISKNLKGRTSQQCRARWHQINNSRSKSCGSGGAAAPPAAAANSGSSRQAVSLSCAGQNLAVSPCSAWCCRCSFTCLHPQVSI